MLASVIADVLSVTKLEMLTCFIIINFHYSLISTDTKKGVT